MIENLEKDVIYCSRVAELALSTFGPETQVLKSVEKMSELIHALIKFAISPDEEMIARIREEVADVIITTLYLQFIFDSEKIHEIVLEKLDKLKLRIDKILEMRKNQN